MQFLLTTDTLSSVPINDFVDDDAVVDDDDDDDDVDVDVDDDDEYDDVIVSLAQHVKSIVHIINNRFTYILLTDFTINYYSLPGLEGLR